jgi:hypothetical protein
MGGSRLAPAGIEAEHIPGGAEVIRHYHAFRSELPVICSVSALEADRLTFVDLSKMITDWLETDG